MRKAWITAVFAIFAATLFGFVAIEDDPIQKVARQLEKWLAQHPQERVHLHFDKPYYAAGEDIWFKAYVTVGPEHRLSAISGILNVELIGRDDSLAQRLKIPLSSGLGWGDINLPDTLPEGDYRIRAYTNWMRNASEDYFFDKTINIINAATNKVFTRADFTYSTSNSKPKINAAITYTDIDSVPYAGKQVSYIIEVDARTIAKGKGTTDPTGRLLITFENKTPELFTSGRLKTTLAIDDEQVVKTVTIKATSTRTDVQFFPEGGYLVNGAVSKVAFKAVGADGLGQQLKGVVKDGQGNIVTAFSAQHLGMGVFDFTPQAGKSYTAVITFNDGSEKTVAFPQANDAGYLLAVDNSTASAVSVKVTGKNVPGAQSLSFVAQSGGKVVYAGRSRPGSTDFRVSIPKTRFSTGITQFTLFSPAGEPLCERLIFVKTNDLLTINVAAAKPTYTPREKVKLNIMAGTGRDSLFEGSFSVAVIDETRVKPDEAGENTIITDLLLTGELRGYIEKPNYYFMADDDKTQANLDVLMLTQGYRRFEWKRLLGDDLPAPVFKAEKTLDISGTITQKGKPVAGAKVSMFSSTGNIFTADTVADAQGRFTFSNLVFADSASIILQASTPKGKRDNISIVLDKVPPPPVGKNKNTPDILVNLDKHLLAYLRYSKELYTQQILAGTAGKPIMLKEVQVREKREVAKNSSNLNGPGRANQVIDFSKDVTSGCITLEQCLAGRLAGVIFNGGKPATLRGGDMLVVLDGMYMDNTNLSVINMNDVATVEVLRTVGLTAIYGPQAGGGVLVITTKRGEPNYNYLKKPAPGVMGFSPQGYFVTRAFYSPVYGDAKTHEKLADMRSTIYWNPNVFTNKQGSAAVEYFNAAGKGTYRVTVEGINNAGQIGRAVYRYKVE